MNNQKRLFSASLLGGIVSVVMILGVQATQLGVAVAEETVQSGDVGRGAGLWSQNCARCHNMRDPKEFRDEQWRLITTHMRIRGGLTGQDTRDIVAFLQASN